MKAIGMTMAKVSKFLSPLVARLRESTHLVRKFEKINKLMDKFNIIEHLGF